MEIERKFKVRQLPEQLEQYPRQRIEQAYLCTEPVIRVRRSNFVTWMALLKGKSFYETAFDKLSDRS